MHTNRAFCALWGLFFLLLSSRAVFAGQLRLEDLIDEALRNNHDVLMAQSRWKSATYKTPQAGTLPEPMFMFGYQNESWKLYTYGELEDSEWMFSLSQMFPFPGKLPLKTKMAEKDADALNAVYEAVRQRVTAEVKERYFELFLIYKSLDLIEKKKELFLKAEEAALSRYSAGMAPQQEVLMAQTEKYMLLEREKMLMQRLEAAEAMLNSTLGRVVKASMGRPEEPPYNVLNGTFDEHLLRALQRSPEIKAKQKMVEASEYKVSMAKKEYYPDFTLTGSVFLREKPFEDMWSLTTTVNIPLYYKARQRNAVSEAVSQADEAVHELEAQQLMISSSIRENYSMAKTAEGLMALYREGLIPKGRQSFESALAGYMTGRVELITLIKSLTTLLDYEIFYWEQFAVQQKAISRLDALTAGGAR